MQRDGRRAPGAARPAKWRSDGPGHRLRSATEVSRQSSVDGDGTQSLVMTCFNTQDIDLMGR